MRKIFVSLLIVASLFSSAQTTPAPAPKDTVQKTFVLIGTEQLFQFLNAVILQARLPVADGIQLLQWLGTVKEIPATAAPKK